MSTLSTSIQGVNKQHMHSDEMEEVYKNVHSLWKSSLTSHESDSTHTCGKAGCIILFSLVQ